MKKEWHFKDGKKDGLYRKWYDNGWLKLEQNYTDGKEEGLVRSYWGPHISTSVVDAETGLIVEKYEERGADKANQVREEYYTKDYDPHGLFREWHRNGQLRGEYNYTDGKRDGLCRDWYKSGQLQYQGNYKDGKLISHKCWDIDGNERECDY